MRYIIILFLLLLASCAPTWRAELQEDVLPIKHRVVDGRLTDKADRAAPHVGQCALFFLDWRY